MLRLIFSWIAMQTHWNMLFSRMRDLKAIDSLLLKELKSCCAKEYSFLPREAGLKLMESACAEVTHWPNFTFLAVCAGLPVCLSDVYLIYCGAFSESQWSVREMQRHPSGRAVGPDQFLWLQHPNVCSSCQFAWQIPHHYEGSDLTKHSSEWICILLWGFFFLIPVYIFGCEISPSK